MSALEVPEEAIEKAREVAMRTGSTRASVEAAAPLVVAAYLEQLRAVDTQHLTYEYVDIFEGDPK